MWILVTKSYCNAQTGRWHIANQSLNDQHTLGNHFATDRLQVANEAPINHRLITHRWSPLGCKESPPFSRWNWAPYNWRSICDENKTASWPVGDQWNLWVTKSVTACDRFGSAIDRRFVATSIKPCWHLWDFFATAYFFGCKVIASQSHCLCDWV